MWMVELKEPEHQSIQKQEKKQQRKLKKKTMTEEDGQRR